MSSPDKDFDQQLTLGEVIDRLEKEDPDRRIPFGFAKPNSYRMDYAELAFEPDCSVSIHQMLSDARTANGRTYEGYRGGDYDMSSDTPVNLAKYGKPGIELTGKILEWMLSDTRFGESDEWADISPPDNLARAIENIERLAEREGKSLVEVLKIMSKSAAAKLREQADALEKL